MSKLENWKYRNAVKEGTKEAVLEYLRTKVKDDYGNEVELGELIIKDIVRGEIRETLYHNVDKEVIKDAVSNTIWSYIVEFGLNR